MRAGALGFWPKAQVDLVVELLVGLRSGKISLS